MSAEPLKRAATLMRDQQGPSHERHATWSAMADWLDRLYGHLTDFSEYEEDEELTAALMGDGDLSEWPEVEDALAVARAYLGDPA